MKRKTALITGITGMVGSHLADYLLKNTDWYIYGMCRWRSPFDNIKHLISRIEKKDRLEITYGDLNDYISLQNVIEISKPNYVFHLAAQSYPKTSFESPLDTLNTNILGTAKLLEAIKKYVPNSIIHTEFKRTASTICGECMNTFNKTFCIWTRVLKHFN